MKRQTLQIGSALLATTALSSVAIAGSVINASGTATGTTLTALNLSAQVFGGNTPEAIRLGPAAWNFDLTNSLTSKFNLEVRSTNSDFVTTATAAVGIYSESGTTLQAATSFTGCTVQVLTDRILVQDCLDVSSNSGAGIDVLQISGIVFDEANGLATVGNTIALDGSVVGDGAAGTFETITSATVITSINSLAGSHRSGTAGTILNTATPAFSTLTGGAVTLNLGAVTLSAGTALSTDLSDPVGGAIGDLGASFTNLVTSLNLNVTHGVLTDVATTNLVLTPSGGVAGANTTFVPTTTSGNTASFTIAVGTTPLGSYDIVVNFDNSDPISAWPTGTLDATYSVGASINLAAIGATSGGLASLTRSGMQAQVNTAQSSTGAGTTFNSLVRIVNNGSVSGTATIIVLDDADGSTLGTYTTGTIAPGATLQVDIPTIEAGAGITPDGGQYGLSVSGAFTGYIQHLMFNTATQSLVDLSGFRNSGADNNP
jgi:hypothetical protein